MPCLSGTYDPETGILLQVFVSPGGNFDKIVEVSHEKPQLEELGFLANGLLDTGADITCISSKLAQSMGLRPDGKLPLSGVTGSRPMNQYVVDLLLRFGESAIPFTNHTVTEFQVPDTSVIAMLIGRDIICKGVLTMDFAGRFTFSI